ncbi:MAG TPA: signal peptidase I [Candidatus Binataceae bacterium]|nr:signal peptidase I [Candidatus Binataceae bacterium]
MTQPAHNFPGPPPSTAIKAAAPAKAEKSATREYIEALIIALALALFIRTFLIQAYKIPSGSMEPTLLVGDHILVNKMAYGIRMPDSIFGIDTGPFHLGKYLMHFSQVQRGDVIVFVFPGDRTKDFIKRVIGVPGDVVQVKQGQVWLNGQPMPDPHAHFEISASDRTDTNARDHSQPLTVPPGKLFMMGDNRDRSFDSRYWGFVDENDVEGRAVVIYFPWNEEKAEMHPFWNRTLEWFKYVNWDRLGMLVH